MQPACRLAITLIASAFAPALCAQTADPRPEAASADPTAAPVAAPAPASESPAEPRAEPRAAAPGAQPAPGWSGALGFTAAFRPQYPGAARKSFRATPAFYLAYDRYSITNASSLAPRRGEDVARGLGVQLIDSTRLRLSFSLRHDVGRKEKGTAAYRDMGNIASTVRARLAANYSLGGPWRVGGAWNADVLGRGNGGIGDVSLGWEHRLAPDTLLSASSFVAFGNARYMQAYYGVSAAQAQRTDYPAYTARGGLRDAGVASSLRHDVGRDWTVLAGASATRLLAAAAASPLTRSRTGWGVNAGAAWHF
jgi:outer membrane scaffolding protein for murein synthesis (MipA/OmpV family)